MAKQHKCWRTINCSFDRLQHNGWQSIHVYSVQEIFFLLQKIALSFGEEITYSLRQPTVTITIIWSIFYPSSVQCWKMEFLLMKSCNSETLEVRCGLVTSDNTCWSMHTYSASDLNSSTVRIHHGRLREEGGSNGSVYLRPYKLSP